MPRRRNTLLDGLLQEYGFTHEELADQINRVGGALLGTPPHCTDRHVRRWVSGEVRWPWTRYLVPLQEIFGRSPEELGFVPRGASSWVPAQPPPTPTKEPPVRRRDFITTGLAATLGFDAIPSRGRLGTGDLDTIRGITAALRRQDQALGGGALHLVAADALGRVRHVLTHCTYGDGVGRQLYAAAGDLAVSAGWFAFDAGRQREATALYQEALQAAILGRDGSLQARVWSHLTMQAWTRRHEQEALRIARATVETRQARTNARLAALLHARLALGYARTGQRSLAERALGRAESAFDRDRGEPDAWLFFFTAAELSGMAGAVCHALGQHRRAAASTGAALELIEPQFERNRAIYRAQHARTLVCGGEVEGAAAEARQVLAVCGRLQSQRIREWLHALRGEFGRYGDCASAVEFREETRGL